MTSTADDQVVYTGMIMNKYVLVYGSTLWQDRASLSRILAHRLVVKVCLAHRLVVNHFRFGG